MTGSRIARVEAWPVAYTEPNDHDGQRFVTIVRLTADDGTTGWGEAVTLFREAALATAVLVDGLAEVVVGADAGRPAALWHAVKEQTWWYGEGGIATFALSAIDIAAWDLTGRLRGVPVVDLLGGAVHESLPICVTSHATMADLGEEAERFAGWIDELRAIGCKVGFGKRGEANLGFDHDRDIAFVRRLRGAIGDERQIMIDLGVRVRWSVADAVRRVRGFEEERVHWVEEPLGADNPAGYATLRAKTNTLIAYGEREWTVSGYRRIVDTGTVDVVGIDAGRAEGLTGFMRASQYASSAQRQVNAHAFAGPLSYAAGLAASLVSPTCHQMEVAPLVNSAVRDLAPTLPRPSHGRVTALPGAGLGVEIDESALGAMRLEP
ncbi:mandelate racemase/muconate lactonizing enzyme family protein [Asanoa siamensis]|uniref:Enolase n=1 Tax=Asanoa siamensis TaxID=926357 RepID=A0ABQ4CT23_9ACTN|nr:mandelate racemase/muconate lactonizing enzyme family protein [Asanoa siamensis]GIF74440.1 enolase [Asanoa siamensis]